MAEQFSPPPGSMGCLSVIVVISAGLACGLSYRAVGSLNPVDAFDTATTGQLIGISVCCVFTGLFGLNLFALWMKSVASRRIDPRLTALAGCLLWGTVILILSFVFSGLLNPYEGVRLIK